MSRCVSSYWHIFTDMRMQRVLLEAICFLLDKLLTHQSIENKMAVWLRIWRARTHTRTGWQARAHPRKLWWCTHVCCCHAGRLSFPHRKWRQWRQQSARLMTCRATVVLFSPWGGGRHTTAISQNDFKTNVKREKLELRCHSKAIVSFYHTRIIRQTDFKRVGLLEQREHCCLETFHGNIPPSLLLSNLTQMCSNQHLMQSNR